MIKIYIFLPTATLPARVKNIIYNAYKIGISIIMFDINIIFPAFLG